MTYPQMDPDRLDLTGTFGLRLADQDASEVRIGTLGRWAQRINLATNPSFEATSGTVTVRTNLALIPVPTGTGAAPANQLGWGTRWAGQGGTQVTSLVTGASDGPDPRLTSYLRKTWTAVGTNAQDIGFQHTASTTNGIQAYPVTAGDTWTISAWYRHSWTSTWVDAPGSQPRAAMRVFFFDAAGAPASPTSVWSSSVGDPANTWFRPSLTFTVPAGVAFVAPVLWAYANVTDLTVGSTFDGTALLWERTPVLYPYFDGAMQAEPDPDLTPAWTGAANASTSVLRGVVVQGISGATTDRFTFSSTRWASGGTRSARVVPRTASNDSWAQLGLTLAPGRTYRVSAIRRLLAPQSGTLHSRARSIMLVGYRGAVAASSSSPQGGQNQAGEERVSLTWSVPSDVTTTANGGIPGATLRLYNGASFDNGEVWWDDLLIEDVTDGLPDAASFFDGDSPSSSAVLHHWAGPAHASASVATEAWQPS